MGALAVSALAIGGTFACKGKGGDVSQYQWVTIDEKYAPKNAVEEFIKNDAEVRDSFPIQIKSYGNDPKILKRFKGSRFAQANKNVLGMFFKGMEDWMIVDLKWKVKSARKLEQPVEQQEEQKIEQKEEPKKELEAKRTMLYIFAGGKWTVADSGTLLE